MKEVLVVPIAVRLSQSCLLPGTFRFDTLPFNVSPSLPTWWVLCFWRIAASKVEWFDMPLSPSDPCRTEHSLRYDKTTTCSPVSGYPHNVSPPYGHFLNSQLLCDRPYWSAVDLSKSYHEHDFTRLLFDTSRTYPMVKVVIILPVWDVYAPRWSTVPYVVHQENKNSTSGGFYSAYRLSRTLHVLYFRVSSF